MCDVCDGHLNVFYLEKMLKKIIKIQGVDKLFKVSLEFKGTQLEIIQKIFCGESF